jgi:opacity protein-like surface antigen
MKSILGAIFGLFACACSAQAQDAVFPGFFADSVSYSRIPAASSLVPEPPPDPQPRRRESSRLSGSLQIGLGYEYVRFRSAPFNANLNGLHTSFTYFRNDWLGFEGSVVAAFGSSTLNNQPSHLALYTVGPHFAWRQRSLQPWVHALAGGVRVFPQTASGTNGFALQLGGGVDVPFKPLVSLRFESDYLRSQLYSSGQNSFQLGAGLVFHF